MTEHQPTHPVSDWELMERLAEGDERALGEMIARHEQSLLSFSHRYLGDHEEAQDIVQEVFVRAYKNAARYRPNAQLHTWLFSICVNLCFTVLRRRKRSPLFGAFQLWGDYRRRDGGEERGVQMPPGPLGTQPTYISTQKELSHQVREAIDRLPVNQKAAVLLRHFDELSYQEISLVLNCSVPSVESLLFRARQKLAKELEGYIRS